MKEEENKDKVLVCQDCGTTENVTETTCPFASEIYGKEVDIAVCSDCYRERLYDI